MGIQSNDISGTNNYSWIWNQNIENIPSEPRNMGFIDRTDILLDYIIRNNRRGNSRSDNSRSDRTNWRMW